MAMAEYQCPSCYYSFERYDHNEDVKNQILCPQCGAEGAVKKELTPRRINEEWLKYLESHSCHFSFG